MMKNLLVITLGFCAVMGISLQAKAQETAPASHQASTPNAIKGEFQELRQMAESFRKEEEPLRKQMKVEMDKIRQLRLKMKTMREEHRKAMDEERVKLGLPSETQADALASPAQK